ncbi:MAG TPA: hypothetical protein EYP65_00560, partial [Armatimonadetes bacterium]|nr:hypothetical protein [Armatimonadota bacterium]
MAERLTVVVRGRSDLPQGLPVTVEAKLGGISVWWEGMRRARLRDEATGDEVPVQVAPAREGKVELTFQLPRAVPEGEEALFEVEASAPRAPRYDFEVVPQPGGRLSVLFRGKEVAGYIFSPTERLPYVYPLVGPSGVSVTRIGHPHDPEGHGHHKSLWISHKDVGGASFWEEGSKGRIRHERFLHLLDGPVFAEFSSESVWEAEGKPLLRDRRAFRFFKLPG